MRRIWLVLLTIASLNSVMLSGCPIQPVATDPSRDTAGGGNGY
jgi:hypothetical protein